MREELRREDFGKRKGAMWYRFSWQVIASLVLMLTCCSSLTFPSICTDRSLILSLPGPECFYVLSLTLSIELIHTWGIILCVVDSFTWKLCPNRSFWRRNTAMKTSTSGRHVSGISVLPTLKSSEWSLRRSSRDTCIVVHLNPSTWTPRPDKMLRMASRIQTSFSLHR